MKKITMYLAATAVAATALSGCGSDDSSASDTAMASASASAMEKDESMESGDAMESEESMEDKAMEDKDAMEHDDSMADEDSAMMDDSSRYITYDAYSMDPSAYADSTTVLFFTADWCPKCRESDAAFKKNPDLIPSDATLVSVDFDDHTDLRKKYGVTMQHTFVQLDEDGNAVHTWQSGDAKNLAENIKS